MTNRRMHLVAYLKTGPTALHAGGWRHPEARLDDILEPARYEQIARELEAACFDACFFADLLGLYDIHGGSFETYVRDGGQISYLDPMTVLPIMANATRHLGLGATLSTTFIPAYLIARSLGSLDVISKGRVAWNIVTSATDLEARNFGTVLPPREVRYDHADEVVEACLRLWGSWDADAFVLDKARGVMSDPAKVHYANYDGKWVKTRGPLSIPRSPQGHPVLMQAGSSDRGRDFAARWAELVFVAQATRSDMQAFRKDLHGRMEKRGRSPEDCKVLVETRVIVGETDSIARDKADYLDSLAKTELNLASVSSSVGVDLTKTKEVDLAQRGTQGMQGSADLLAQIARTEGGTMREAASKVRSGQIIGAPKTVADVLEDQFVSGACDGFVLSPLWAPGTHESICRAVVPELQRRGLFRTAYTGRTLRENLAD
jgi:FMN-dependent oxidoreductase (nitrilotriacetate monooxygenase family)